MKEKIFSKKKLLGFSPELHWDMMLLFFLIILIGISGYFSYLYVTLSHRIEYVSANATTDSSQASEEQSIQKIINMESVIGGYREREKVYTTAIDSLAKRAPVTETRTASTTTTSSVASSTVR